MTREGPITNIILKKRASVRGKGLLEPTPRSKSPLISGNSTKLVSRKTSGAGQKNVVKRKSSSRSKSGTRKRTVRSKSKGKKFMHTMNTD